MRAENEHSVQRAIRDLVEIRRVIARAEQHSGEVSPLPPSQLHFYVHIALFVLALITIIVELVRKPSLTDLLYISHYHEQLRFVCIGVIAIVLILLSAALYFAVWKAARKADETFEDYVARNFRHLLKLSFLSDLFVKFTAVSVVLLAGRGDWVAPLLLIFIGDYLLQGRLFVLQVRLSLVLGFVCIAFGVCQLVFMAGLLIYPLVMFLVVCALSIGYIFVLRRESGVQED